MPTLAATARHGRPPAIAAFASHGITRYVYRGICDLTLLSSASGHTSEHDSCHRPPPQGRRARWSRRNTCLYCAAPLFGYGPVRLRSPTSHRQRRRALPSLAVRLYASHDAEADLLARIATVDIYGICAVVLLWSALLTVGIGAFIVLVMKGPAYVADAYPLPDSDAPLP